MKIYTIGYEGLDIDSFLSLLAENDIETVVDVREMPLSRKPGFSKKSLEAVLNLSGREYVHMVAFGCPKPVRDRYRTDGNWKRYTEGFLKYHPDLRWRRIGLQRFEDGEHADALNAFMHSSRFADKGAQAMVAEMYWTGQGTPVDRALAYAWMDLAAERGYKDFLKIRERYWNQLDDAERSRGAKRHRA